MPAAVRYRSIAAAYVAGTGGQGHDPGARKTERAPISGTAACSIATLAHPFTAAAVSAGVFVAGVVLHVTQGSAGVEDEGDRRVPQGVRRQPLPHLDVRSAGEPTHQLPQVPPGRRSVPEDLARRNEALLQ
jgi:anti-sigma factor RsiW